MGEANFYYFTCLKFGERIKTRNNGCHKEKQEDLGEYKLSLGVGDEIRKILNCNCPQLRQKLGCITSAEITSNLAPLVESTFAAAFFPSPIQATHTSSDLCPGARRKVRINRQAFSIHG